jgi:gamma-glutamyltranspeptidase
MVVSAQRLATEVGVEVLKKGGNAVDAAVAVGYALAVVYPAAGNLGGGGFMTLQLADGRKTFLDFREKAPLAATPGMYLDAGRHRRAARVDARSPRGRGAGQRRGSRGGARRSTGR